MEQVEYVSNEIPDLYEVNIDFDDASTSWRANKKSIGNGNFKYVCSLTKRNKKCNKVCHKESDYCWIHRKHQTNK